MIKSQCVLVLEITYLGCTCILWFIQKMIHTPLRENRWNKIKIFMCAAHRTYHVGIRHVHRQKTNNIGHGKDALDVRIWKIFFTKIRKHPWSPPVSHMVCAHRQSYISCGLSPSANDRPHWSLHSCNRITCAHIVNDVCRRQSTSSKACTHQSWCVPIGWKKLFMAFTH